MEEDDDDADGAVRARESSAGLLGESSSSVQSCTRSSASLPPLSSSSSSIVIGSSLHFHSLDAVPAPRLPGLFARAATLLASGRSDPHIAHSTRASSFRYVHAVQATCNGETACGGGDERGGGEAV